MMRRFLYLEPGSAPPDRDRRKNKFSYLSRYFRGDLIAPIWEKKNEHAFKTIKEINNAIGNFRYHVTFDMAIPRFIKTIWEVIFYLLRGLYIYYFGQRYDFIISYGILKTGLAGCFLKLLTKTKLIVEVSGNPTKQFLYDNEKPLIFERFYSAMSKSAMKLVINSADHVKLLYPGQIDTTKSKKVTQYSIFHDFVPVGFIRDRYRNRESEQYILFLGYPWFLKGVDVLIKAFKVITGEFPGYRLRIFGYCPENRAFFQKIAAGNNKIELNAPVLYEEALELMSRCSLFVLPSRTEAMGRVLLEAMACRKPIIASNVDGIPYYIDDGVNGLLFESENVRDLADKMRMLLTDTDYATMLAQNGFNYVQTYLSEDVYVAKFKKMVDITVS
jgi:glycosyltransferase involved in cell wall biosynthesis